MLRWPSHLLVAAIVSLTASGCQLNAISPVAELEAPDQLPPVQTSYLDLGLGLLSVKDYDAARDAFIRSLRTEGRTAEALSGAGVASEKQGLLNDARRYFEMAVNAVPNSVVAHNNLGAVLYKLGEFNAAKQAFQAAFALSSGSNEVAAQNLGITELAIRREYNNNLPLASNPRALQRLGSGEYKLQEKKTSKSEG